MKRFIYLLLAIIFLISISIMDVEGVSYETSFEVEGYTYEDMEYLQNQIAEKEALMLAAHDMAAAARTLGYDDAHDVVVLAKNEYESYKRERDAFQSIYNRLSAKWQDKQSEYPEATLIWSYLKEAGYSNYICAGIMGNIMTEVGGNTLAIQPYLQTTKHYGICQWSSYYPEVWGLSVEGQCDFLINTIENEINSFGKLYRKNMNYEEFIAMTDCRQIALCFAKAYERCGSGGYNARQDNAVVAYNYFAS